MAAEVRQLATELYSEKYRYLMANTRRNTATGADAGEAVREAIVFFISDDNPQLGAPPLAWLTLVMKRRCWRLRDAAHLDRRIAADPDGEHEQPTALIERQANGSRPVAERVVECDEARRRLWGLKPDQRNALILKAASYSYEEIGAPPKLDLHEDEPVHE